MRAAERSAAPVARPQVRGGGGMPSAIAQVGLVFWKDLLVEWRGRMRLLGLAVYAVALLLLFSFAVGPDTDTLARHAGAYLWLVVLSASTLLLAQSFQNEVEGGALEGLLLVPVDPRSLFYGKALANAVLLSGLACLSLAAAAFLFGVDATGSLPRLLGVIALGALGVSAPGTLYAGLTARMPSRQLLLPVLMFPLLVPALLAAVKATSLLVEGDPMGQVGSWAAVLLVFDLVYWSLCGVLFARMVEE